MDAAGSLESLVGKTQKAEFATVGTMYYDENLGDPGLGVDYTDLELAVECRGEGTIRVVRDCSPEDVLATIPCTEGTRPWTAMSTAFPANEDGYDVQVAAEPGFELQWANPRLVAY